jgi:formate dehydrogenase major subunit
MVDAAGAGRLKALWAIGYDVTLTNPQATETRRALRSLELVIVQDMFLNELARECGKVFLPACSSFERDGTFMNSERRVQRIRTALPPIGGSRPDWEIICEVARAMGHDAQFAFRSPKEIWNEVRAVWPAGRGITYERLDARGLQWPCPTEDHPGTAILHVGKFTIGDTAPMRRVDFTPTDETQTAEFPFLLTTGRTLYQFNAGTMTQRTRNAELRESDTLDIAPRDAAQLDLHDGDRVRVRSRHGEAVLPVRVSDAVKPGELFATFHTVEVFLNKLTSGQRDHIVQTPEYKVVAVAVEKAAPETAQSPSP